METNMTIKLAFLKWRVQQKLQVGCCLGLILLAAFTPVQARVTRTVVDETKALPLGVDGLAYLQIAGRAFGKLDPQAPGNRIIQDIELATSAVHKAAQADMLQGFLLETDAQALIEAAKASAVLR
jgi:hypothetical protein